MRGRRENGSYRTARLTLDGKTGSFERFRSFSSLEEKYKTLISECKDGNIRSGPAHEVLRQGGDLELFWIDVDTRDHDLFYEWAQSSACPMSQDCFRCVPSSSGNIHMYVSADVPLPLGMLRWGKVKKRLCETMPSRLARRIHKMAGSNSEMSIYLPCAHLGRAVLPQDLFSGPVGIFRLSRWL